PQRSSLLGLVSVIAPAIVSGATVVVLASERRPLPAVLLGEVLSAADVPGAVVNILTGRTAPIAAALAADPGLDTLDLAGTADAGEATWAQLAAAAADAGTRVLPPSGAGPLASASDWTVDPGLHRLRAFVDIKTISHPR